MFATLVYVSNVADEFGALFEELAPQLKSALVAAFGQEDGRDAAAEALAWAWTNWDRLTDVDNRGGYLYRVGRSHALRQQARRHRESPHLAVGPPVWETPEFEPGLLQFLAALPEQQRVCVWLVHGLGHTLADTADLLGCSRGTVSTHVRRALDALRSDLEVHP